MLYWVTGGDGKEYGPVAVEQVRQWVAQGRLNRESRVRMEGSQDSQALGDIPEFSGLFAGAGIGAPPPVFPSPGAAEAIEREVLSRDYQIDFGGILQKSWALLMANFWLLVASNGLIVLLAIAIECIPTVGQIAGMVLLGPLWTGTQVLALKLVRGHPAELSDVFAGFGPLFLPLAASGIIYHLGVAVGLLLCVIPGIYLATAWMFSWLLIADRGGPFWDCMELSRKMVQKHLLACVLLLSLELALIVGGIIALGIGVFVAVPLINLIHCFAYENIFGARAAAPIISPPPA